MTRPIGFLKTEPPEPQIPPGQVHIVALSPQPNTSLSLARRLDLVGRQSWASVPWLANARRAVEGQDELVIRSGHRVSANLLVDEALRFRKKGELLREQHLEMDGSRILWFEADQWLKDLVGFSIDAASLLSCLPGRRAIQIAAYSTGLQGTSPIFNPPRERYRTVCLASEPVGGEEIVEVAGQTVSENSLRAALHSIANKVLNEFRVDGAAERGSACPPFDYLSEAESSALFAAGAGMAHRSISASSEDTNSAAALESARA